MLAAASTGSENGGHPLDKLLTLGMERERADNESGKRHKRSKGSALWTANGLQVGHLTG
jgi:hypothetical protein